MIRKPRKFRMARKLQKSRMLRDIRIIRNIRSLWFPRSPPVPPYTLIMKPL